MSHAINLLSGIKKSRITFVIDQEEYNSKITLVRDRLSKYDVDVNNFDINNFLYNEDIREYSKQIDFLFFEYFDEIQINRIIKYREDYLKYDFLKVLDNQSSIYKSLISLINSNSFKELQNIQYKLSYEEELKNLFNDIVLNDKAGMTLADIYIEPGFRIHDYCFSIKNKDSNNPSSDKGFRSISNESIHSFINKAVSNKNLGVSLTSQHKNLIFILGYPGQGKSSFCKKILYDIYGEKKINISNTFYVKIRNITDTVSLLNNPIQTIFDHWTLENNEKVLGITKGDIYNSLLIIDGLDELFIKEKLQESAIDEFCRIMIRETEDKPNLNVIITSRYGYINLDSLKKSHSIILQLEEFSEEQQVSWLKKYMYFHPETNLNEHKLSLYNNSNAYRPIKELINQPILLHLIATLNQDLTTNSNRATIYNNLFTELIQRSWAVEGQIDNLKGINNDDLREFLRDIAYAIFDSGREYIHKSILIKLPETSSFINKLDYKSKIQDVLKTVMIAFYFQETKKEQNDTTEDVKNDYAIEFLHKSLQEYLVAEKIWENLQSLVDKDTRKGKYIIDSPKIALGLINKFLKKRISGEILGNLIQIINTSDATVREELSERINFFLPDWLSSGLILDFEWKSDNYNADESLIVFNLFNIITNLVDGKNYLENVNYNFFTGKRLGISLKDQIFKGNIGNVFKERPDSFKYSIYQFQFEVDEIIRKKGLKFKFDSIYIHSARFIQFSSFIDGYFSNSYIMSSDFMIATVATRHNIKNPHNDNSYKFDKCRINYSTFFEGPFIFYNSVFKDCVFSGLNYLVFKNCIFKNCIFYYYEPYSEVLFDKNKLINCVKMEIKRLSESDPDLVLLIDESLRHDSL